MSDFCYYRNVLYVDAQQWLHEFAQLLRLSMTLDEAYSLLGISRGASPVEINKAYRAKVMEWHPDRNPDKPDAHQKMVEINIAKDILDGKRRPDFGYTAPPPPRAPHAEEYVIDFDGAVRAAGVSAAGTQWVAVSRVVTDELTPTDDIKVHQVRAFMALGVRLGRHGADLLIVAAYHVHKQIQNVYQDKTWRNWVIEYEQHPLPLSQRGLLLSDVWSKVRFVTYQRTPSSFYLLTSGVRLSEHLPNYVTSGAPLDLDEVMIRIQAVATPTPQVIQRTRTFEEAVRASYYELDNIEWRLVTEEYAAHDRSDTPTKPHWSKGFLAYGISGEQHVCLYAVRKRHYDDSAAPYSPTYDDDRWEIYVQEFPITKKLDTFLARTFEHLFDNMLAEIPSTVSWNDRVYHLADHVKLNEHLPASRHGAPMTVAEAVLRLPATFKREIARVTQEQALATVEGLPTVPIKWLFHTRDFVTKGPGHSATETDTRSAVVACGKTSTQFVFVVRRHVLLNAMHSGLKSEHDVYHFKAYVYPIAKAPLSDLTARAINKCLDEAQLYQRTRFDNMVRPFIGPLKDIRPEGLGFVALVEYLKQFTRQQRSEEEAEAAATADVRVEFEVQLSKLPKPGFWSAGLNEAPFKGAYFKLTLYLSNTPYPITQRDFQRIAKLRFADTRADVITLIFGNVKKTVKDRRPLTRVNKGRALCNWMANTLQDLPDMAKEELREAASKL